MSRWLFLWLGILFFNLYSCSSLGLEKGQWESYESIEIESRKQEVSVLQWPLPDFEWERFQYLKSPDIHIMDLAVFPIPDDRDLLITAEVESVVEADAEAEIVTVTPQAPQVVETPPAAPIIEEAVKEQVLWTEQELSILQDKDLILQLSGGGWVFKNDEEDGSLLMLKERVPLLALTQFIFAPPPAGEYTLVFKKDDPQTGALRGIKYRIQIEKEVILQDTGQEHSESQGTEITGKDGWIKRLHELDLELDDPAEAIEILENVISYSWSDEEYAGYLYALARQLERNGVTQDVKRSKELYQQIQNSYFLTSYFQKAQARIYYLDRHFFLLQ